jgi:dTDP-4-dehydro-6-deoxy-alpha-D-glucopyranose 2,3-dehydratase
MNKNLNKLKNLSKVLHDTKKQEPKEIKECLTILKTKNANLKLKSKLINLNKVRNWENDKNGNIYHESGQFFSIQGVRTSLAYDREVTSWDQPIFNQLHGGILAIIAKITKGKGVKFLLRVKAEPGDDGKVKFCPTFQATTSNINQAHGGKRPPFFEEIIKRKNTELIYSSSHYEEGGRFWKKINQNAILLANSNFKNKNKDFYWLSLTQIKKLALKNNILNPFVKTILFML